MKDALDHLLFGVSDLNHGIEWFERHCGVRAAAGGVHPGRGTRNALVSLGAPHYLEVIAPDPAQTTVEPQYQVRSLREPRLVTFAVRTDDMDGTMAALKRAGVQTSGLMDGSRRTTDGMLLRWRSLRLESKFQEAEINPIPFFIEWASGSAHPSKSAPGGCTIESLRFEHPRAEELRDALGAMGLEAEVRKADRARIIANLQTPKGRVELV